MYTETQNGHNSLGTVHVAETHIVKKELIVLDIQIVFPV